MSRNLPSFIEGFMQYTEGRGSPRLYRKWTAIFLVAAVMERKCWMTTVKGKLFPNQYILLVGPAGVGKSLCTVLAQELLNSIRTPETPFHMAPSSVTKASLIDCLADADRRIVRPMETPSVVQFNGLTIVPNEFGVFLPSWEADFMSTLTDLWDCGRYAETRRTSKINIELPHTQLNLLSATTPAQLINLLPEGAWEQGFMSRVLMAYSGDTTFTPLFDELDYDGSLKKKLESDIKNIYEMFGEFSITEETKEAINSWGTAGGPPIPEHPKLTSYRTRRIAHLLKLCMVASAADDSEKIITLDHFQLALDWLVELEGVMPDIFKSLKIGGDARALEECYHFVYEKYLKGKKKPVPEHLVYAFLQERVPAHSVDRIIENMVRAQLLNRQLASSGNGFVPRGKQA